ncbi:uncharacterized protein LOC121745770 [Salvia splendens]|uniref:uncharacterized protein LOC121745770 n=1 Tax=Salvia splendens TaxID=180675 RepID=UPI001C26F1C1|nr:uncharacterized protein LOC121745770 [Salvia splendens]
MEQNLPIIAKKLFKIVKVLYFMLRKGISKGKLLANLSMLMKRGKIAGKAAIHSLMPHHHHRDRHLEYEFSWAKTSAHKRKKQCRPTEEELMKAAVEMFHSATASPALPGFGQSPMVRQLRITDSPFPLRNDEEDNRVDEAAEEFITRFYKDLRQQNCASYS